MRVGGCEALAWTSCGKFNRDNKMKSADTDLTGFRNALVHIYWELDPDVVYDILLNNFGVLAAFKKIMKELLEGMCVLMTLFRSGVQGGAKPSNLR